MSAREPKLPVVLEGVGPLLANNDRARRVSQVNLILPCEQSREPQRAEGAPRNTPPKSSHLSPTVGIDGIDMKQTMVSSPGKPWRLLPLDCVYIFLRERRGLNPIESKASRHLHSV